MLAILGFGMVMTFMTLIMMRRLSPMVALILIPILFAVIAGFGEEQIGPMMLEGIKTLAPTGVMLMFAILYFGLMIDAGLFDPIVRRIVRLVGGDPLKLVIGTAALAAFVSLDGDGSTTYMIVTASMLPLYRRLRMNPLNLTCVTILAGGVMNMTPWGGPLARAASALQVDPGVIFVPLIPAMIVGLAGVGMLAWHLGHRERKRLGVVTLSPAGQGLGFGSLGAAATTGGNGLDDAGLIEDSALLPDADEAEKAHLARPGLLWFNAALTVTLIVALVLGVLPLPALFMIAFSIAILVNYPDLEEQRRRVAEHARNVIAVVSLIFAAGVFTGILSGTGMVDAMSGSLLAVVPPGWGPYFAPILAVASMPFTFFVSNDAFYFGVLPIVSDAAGHYGITHAEMARASLIGQPVHLLSPLVASTYLLVGLAGVEFGDHQRFTIKWAIMVSLMMLAASLVFGVFPLASG